MTDYVWLRAIEGDPPLVFGSLTKAKRLAFDLPGVEGRWVLQQSTVPETWWYMTGVAECHAKIRKARVIR